MSSNIKVNQDSNLISIKADGTVDIEDAVHWLKTVAIHPARTGGMNILCEISKLATNMRAIDVESFLAVIDLYIETFGSNYKVAVVTPEKYSQKVAGIYETYATQHNSPYQIKIFQDPTSAHHWLEA